MEGRGKKVVQRIENGPLITQHEWGPDRKMLSLHILREDGSPLQTIQVASALERIARRLRDLCDKELKNQTPEGTA